MATDCAGLFKESSPVVIIKSRVARGITHAGDVTLAICPFIICIADVLVIGEVYEGQTV